MNPMMEALNKRRGKGLDITIAVTPDKDKASKDSATPSSVEEEKPEMPEMDTGFGELEKLLATPEAREKAKEILSMHEAKEPVAEEGDENLDEELASSMSDYDKQDLEERNPRSLGERARKSSLERMRK